jgi:hypothetical protein
VRVCHIPRSSLPRSCRAGEGVVVYRGLSWSVIAGYAIRCWSPGRPAQLGVSTPAQKPCLCLYLRTCITIVQGVYDGCPSHHPRHGALIKLRLILLRVVYGLFKSCILLIIYIQNLVACKWLYYPICSREARKQIGMVPRISRLGAWRRP